MIAVPANGDLRPIGVLLGGSGRARMPTTLRLHVVPALLNPWPTAPGRPVMAWVSSIAEGRAS